MSTPTRFLVLAAALVLLTACESRRCTLTRPDGTVISYHRATIFGESSSEGVQVSKDGEDLVVEVGPTGSKTEAELLLRAIEIGAGLAAPTP